MSSNLILAAKNGYLSQVEVLLANSSLDINARDKDKATPLYWSASRGHLQICQVLIKAGCDVNACVKWGSTALHAAADRGHVDCLTLLIHSGAYLNVQNQRGDTALHLAAYRGFKDITRILVKARADPFLKNGQSKTPLQEAQSQQHSSTAELLQKYMEALGYKPFKSLPESDYSRQGEPNSSVPSKSWPRYQPPGVPARGHTYPLRINNLSATGSGQESAFGKSIGIQTIALGEVSRCETVNGVSVPKNSSQFHSHLEPQENHDESLDFVQPARSQLDAFAQTSSNAQVHWHYRNGNPRVSSNSPGRETNGFDGLNDAYFHAAVSPGNPSTCPRLHSESSFIKHEDLTRFAESLQLEVVKLRESLASKEEQMAELQRQVLALRVQNAQLLQTVNQRSISDDQMAVVRSQLSEWQGKVYEAEKQKATLLSTLARLETRSNEMTAQRELDVKELTVKLQDMENVNSKLQDTVRDLLARKELEFLKLREDLDRALSQDKRPEFPLIPTICDHSHQSSGSYITASNRSVSPGDTMSPQPEDDLANNYDALVDNSTSTVRSVISVGDQPTTNSSPTRVTHRHKSNLCDSDSPSRTVDCEAPMMSESVGATQLPEPGQLPHSSTNEGKQLPARGDRDTASLRVLASSLLLEEADEGKLDADGKEWKVGREFDLLDSNPVNCGTDGQRKGSCSLVFSISHKGRRYMLKMLMNLINLTYEAHSLGRSLDAHLLHRFGAEFHAPLLLQAHPNIVRVRHHYQGDTSHFRNYLSLLVPPNLDVPVEMARRTTFLVLDQYPLTLQTFLGGPADRSEGCASPVNQLPEQFLKQLLYQLLSAVAYLQGSHVVHRDIKADNIFLDWRLRPILGDFGFARTVCGCGGQALPFTDQQQVFAGNPHAWAPELCRLSRTEPGTLSQPMTLEDVYCKSDGFAVARMFYHHLDNSNSDRFPTTTQQHPDYPDTVIPMLPQPVSPSLGRLLRSLVFDEPSRRPTVREALCRVGVLLFCEPSSKNTTQQATEEWYTSQLVDLTSQKVARPSQPEYGTLSVAESVAANQNHCLADFLSNFTSSDVWEAQRDIYTTVRQ